MTDRRPEQLISDSAEVVRRVHEVRETDDLWRAYRREWVTVYVSVAKGDIGETEVRRVLEERYMGRVLVEDIDVVPAPKPARSAQLKLRLWNLRGEFKHEDAARAHVAAGEGEWEVVPRNSRADHQLRSYAVHKVQGGS